MDQDELDRRRSLAEAAAVDAGRITLRYFQSADLETELKADDTPVTVADREAEALLFDRLLGEFPADAFLGEERGDRPGTSPYRWIVDPIDGTRSFVQGVPLYGVLVALVDASGEPLIGVAHFPALDETVSAAKGRGCRWNDRPARVSDTRTLDEACVVFTGLETVAEGDANAAFDAVSRRARLVRNWGDCYGHILVATGRAEVMLDPVLSDWDCAALLPILEEAGGSFTDWRGARTVFGKSGISTNARVRAEISHLLEPPS